jgi:hypothetical protein
MVSSTIRWPSARMAAQSSGSRVSSAGPALSVVFMNVNFPGTMPAAVVRVAPYRCAMIVVGRHKRKPLRNKREMPDNFQKKLLWIPGWGRSPGWRKGRGPDLISPVPEPVAGPRCFASPWFTGPDANRPLLCVTSMIPVVKP